jgi:hypothetical protein
MALRAAARRAKMGARLRGVPRDLMSARSVLSPR